MTGMLPTLGALLLFVVPLYADLHVASTLTLARRPVWEATSLTVPVAVVDEREEREAIVIDRAAPCCSIRPADASAPDGSSPASRSEVRAPHARSQLARAHASVSEDPAP